MHLSVVNINAFIEHSVCRLIPGDAGAVLKTAFASEELKVVLDPAQIGEGLSALIDGAFTVLPKGEVLTIGTSFVPIPNASANKDGEKRLGCALLYVDLGAAQPQNRTAAYKEGFKKLLLAFRSILKAVKKTHGCARIWTGRGSKARLCVYLPLINNGLPAPPA